MHHSGVLTTIHIIHSSSISCCLIGSNYPECIEIVHCIPRTAPRLREVLLVSDRTRERHIDLSIFFTG